MEPLRLRVNDDIELVQLREEDAEAAFSAIEENRTFIGTWLPWVDEIKTIEDEHRFIASLAEKTNGEKAFGIWHKKTFVGSIGLHAIDEKNQKTSIGYWLAESSNGSGIMTLCVKRMLRYCFEDLRLNRVFIGHATNNVKSKAVIERCGFVQESPLLRSFEKVRGSFLDYSGYSMLASDYKKSHDHLL